MARLIDADALRVIRGINVGANYGGLRAIVLNRDIESAPTVDAVPVVRCKDCLWGKWNQALWDSIYCENIGMDRDMNDYCSMGERREDG